MNKKITKNLKNKIDKDINLHFKDFCEWTMKLNCERDECPVFKKCSLDFDLQCHDFTKELTDYYFDVVKK